MILSPCTCSRAIGHFFEAEDESQEWPQLHAAIRAARKACQADGPLPDWEKLATRAHDQRIALAASPSLKQSANTVALRPYCRYSCQNWHFAVEVVPMTDPTVLAEIGQRLAQHRLERNLTQAELAKEAGDIGPSQIKAIANAHRVNLLDE